MVWFISILLVIVSIVYLSYDRMRFEYYVWNLTDEEYIIREENVGKIVEMGNCAIPMIISKMKKPFMFETYYLSRCMNKITNQDKNFSTEDSTIKYWLNWAKENNYD